MSDNTFTLRGRTDRQPRELAGLVIALILPAVALLLSVTPAAGIDADDNATAAATWSKPFRAVDQAPFTTQPAPVPAPPATSAPTTSPPTTNPTPPPRPLPTPPTSASERSVAVVGDSMFAIGHEAIRAPLVKDPSIDLVSYTAEPGTTVSTNSQLNAVIESDPDVLVLSFQINDVLGYGTEATLDGFAEILERASHIDCIRWVTFYDDINFGPVVEGLQALAASTANLEIVPFHEQVGDHPQWRYPADFPYGGDIHLNPELPGPSVLGEMIAAQTACS